MVSTTTITKQGKATALAQVQALIAGTEKHFPTGSFTLGNAAYTTATLTQALQSLEDGIVTLNAAHASVQSAGLALKAIQAKIGPLMQDYRRFVVSTFGSAPKELADFGLQAPKARKPLSSDKRAAATAKLRATRAARGTTSKKQKLAVKGDVTGVEITPITSTPAASPAAPKVPNAPSPPNTGTASK